MADQTPILKRKRLQLRPSHGYYYVPGLLLPPANVQRQMLVTDWERPDVMMQWRQMRRWARTDLALKLQRFFRRNFEYSLASMGVYDVHEGREWFPVIFSKFRFNRFLAAIQKYVKRFRELRLEFPTETTQNLHNFIVDPVYRRPSRQQILRWAR